MSLRFLALCAMLAVSLGAAGCEGSESRDGDDDDSAPGGDADGDSDADADGDSDADTDEDCYESIDICFVLDVSNSMNDVVGTLREELAVVWSAAEEIDDDPSFGLVVFVDDVSVGNGGMPYDLVEDLQTDFEIWYNHTSTNEQTQADVPNSDYPENTLDGLVAGAENFAWRDPETTLHVIIHATDDGFLEYPDNFASGLPVEHTYEETLEALQSRFIRVGSFVPAGRPGYFTDYDGMSSIPMATSGEAYDLGEVGDTISLANAINGFVIQELCEDYVPQ